MTYNIDKEELCLKFCIVKYMRGECQIMKKGLIIASAIIALCCSILVIASTQLTSFKPSKYIGSGD